MAATLKRRAPDRPQDNYFLVVVALVSLAILVALAPSVLRAQQSDRGEQILSLIHI